MNLYKENNNKILLAVCCDLRETLKNHYFLKNSLKIGEFLSNTEYYLIKNTNKDVELRKGDNSVVFEVYEVNILILRKVEKLKGYYFLNCEKNLNTKQLINTPYGSSYVYINNNKINKDTIIKNYDYVDYVTYNK